MMIHVKGSSLIGRVALTLMLLLVGAAHAIHLGDPNRTQFRVLDACLVVLALGASAWVLSNRGDRRQAANGGFVTLLLLFAIAVVGF